jgi:glucosamine--fructose-6-phosphate aminotransferase (isomerizing)
MCGIVGYVGQRPCSQLLISGLRRLEYRGYDSAGIAIGTAEGKVRVSRAQGKLTNLERVFAGNSFDGTIGIGHTRWATHGRPTEANAHPHRAGRVIVAHNGIIENYAELKARLQAAGRTFESVTDTEVAAHLIDEQIELQLSKLSPEQLLTRADDTLSEFVDLHAATRAALAQMHGSWALVVMGTDNPDQIVVARNASPMVLGIGKDELFAASDVPAVMEHTRDFIFLNDGDTAILSRSGHRIFGPTGEPVERPTKKIQWDPISAEKQGYKHFMLKEIFEQPARLIDTLRGRIDLARHDVTLAEVPIDAAWLAGVRKIVFVACGTSYYASTVGKHWIEQLARVPVECDLASEFRYRDPVIDDQTLCIAVSQSGETADTLAAMRQAKALGARTLAICNVVESTIAREADGVFYTHAGPEIGVASTKAFITQLAACSLLAIWLGRRRQTIDAARASQLLDALRGVPAQIESILADMTPYEQIARDYSQARSWLYLGRGIQHPIACEGALKLKEISYIHAEGYAAGEMKHGPIALIDEHLPVVVFAPQGRVYDKIVSNLEEVRARGGKILAVVTEGDTHVAGMAAVTITIPVCDEFVQPLLTVVAAQLIAYHVADLKGTDVDQPRNLAKSVTVE